MIFWLGEWNVRLCQRLRRPCQVQMQGLHSSAEKINKWIIAVRTQKTRANYVFRDRNYRLSFSTAATRCTQIIKNQTSNREGKKRWKVEENTVSQCESTVLGSNRSVLYYIIVRGTELLQCTCVCTSINVRVEIFTQI